MTTRSKVQNICLSQLVPSPTNVRKTPATAAEDAALEASIRAKGILQNLIVHQAGVDGKGVFEVDAGGRRLTILQKLAAEGAIDPDYKVPCKIEQAEDAVETSLMENTVRAAMHPADEFVAMAELIDAGETIEAVALRFGVSERHVRQRLRLGKLAPELLDAFRAGEISLDAVTAFTLGADHAAQLAVWRQVKDRSYIQAYSVRHLLTDGAVALDSHLGMFVGAAAYEAAGGRITRDLFSGDDDGFMDDPALVRRLAIEKLEAKAAELRPHWAWTKAVLDPDYHFLAQYGRIHPQPAKVPPDLSAEIGRIERRLGELDDIPEGDWTDELAAEADRLHARRAKIDDMIDSLAVFSDEDRGLAGCIVTIGDDGGFCLQEGLVERSPTHTSAPESSDAEDGADPSAISADMDDDNDQASGPRLTSEQKQRKEYGFSQLLVDDLKAHRLQITRAHLAGNFEVAFDLALYWLAADLLELFSSRTRSLDLNATEATPRSSLNDLAGTVADQLLEAHRKTLPTGWLRLPPADGFAAFAALPIEAKQRLFAWCIAACLKPQLSIEDRADPVLECAGRRLAIPFADYWRPTAANYWGRVKKAHGLAIGEKILGDRWARDHADAKKVTLAAALETAFDPAKSAACISLHQSARDGAAAWMPPGMAYDAAAADEVSSDPSLPGADPMDVDNADADEVDAVSTDLPAFLIEGEAAGVALNGAKAP
jgi:ParB family chromosome partitioning protein